MTRNLWLSMAAVAAMAGTLGGAATAFAAQAQQEHKRPMPFNFTDDQRKALKALVPERDGDRQAHEAARAELMQLLAADRPDQAALTAFFDRQAARVQQESAARIEKLKAVRNLLTQAQREQLASRPGPHGPHGHGGPRPDGPPPRGPRGEGHGHGGPSGHGRPKPPLEALGLTSEQRAAFDATKPERPQPGAREQALAKFWRTGDASGLQPAKAPASSGLAHALASLSADQRKKLAAMPLPPHLLDPMPPAVGPNLELPPGTFGEARTPKR